MQMLFAYCFASKKICTVSQKHFASFARSLSDLFLAMRLNATIFCVMSSAMKVKSQHDPMTRQMKWPKIVAKHKDAIH